MAHSLGASVAALRPAYELMATFVRSRAPSTAQWVLKTAHSACDYGASKSLGPTEAYTRGAL